MEDPEDIQSKITKEQSTRRRINRNETSVQLQGKTDLPRDGASGTGLPPKVPDGRLRVEVADPIVKNNPPHLINFFCLPARSAPWLGCSIPLVFFYA